MSLRLRLTFLYSVLMGGVLLIFGSAAYFLVNNILLSRVDNILADFSNDISKLVVIDELGQVIFPSVPENMDINVQVWGLNDKLQASIGPLGRNKLAFDPSNKRAVQPVYQETNVNNIHLRVLTIPIWLHDKRAAVM